MIRGNDQERLLLPLVIDVLEDEEVQKPAVVLPVERGFGKVTVHCARQTEYNIIWLVLRKVRGWSAERTLTSFNRRTEHCICLDYALSINPCFLRTVCHTIEG